MQHVAYSSPVGYQVNNTSISDQPIYNLVDTGYRSADFPNLMEDGTVAQNSMTIDSSPWASMDVPGSPRLTRLLTALSLHNNSIEPLSLSQSQHEYDANETFEVVSTSALRSPSRTEQKDAFLEVYRELLSRRLALAKQHDKSSGEVQMNYKTAEIFFPTGNWINPDPRHELYPFPSVAKQKSRPLTAITVTNLSIPTLESRANSLSTYRATFEKTLPPLHPLNIKTLEDLANTFCEMSDHDKASKYWAMVANLREADEGPIAFETIHAWYMVLRNLHMLGARKAKETAILYDRLEKLLRENFAPDNPLLITFGWIKADHLADRGLYAESERLYRESLQLRLNLWGPTSIHTIRCMASLGKLLILKTKNSVREASTRVNQAGHKFQELPEAKSTENLVCSAMALQKESTEPDMDNLMDLTHITMLISLGRSEEALKLAKIGAEHTRHELGESHATTLQYLDRLAQIFLELRRYQESIHVFQTILRLQKLVETSPDVIERICGLGKAFRGLNQHQEAIVHLDKAFRSGLSTFGALSVKTKEACWNLGDSHNQLEEHAKASDIYNLYIQEIWTAAINEHPFVVEVQGWLADTINYSLRPV